MKYLMVACVAILMVLLKAFFIYALWDDVMVKFFGVADVTFVDSIMIAVLSTVLFKSNNNE